MCAEAVPWRCHRSLVADALVVRGVPAVEILSDDQLAPARADAVRARRGHADHLSARASPAADRSARSTLTRPRVARINPPACATRNPLCMATWSILSLWISYCGASRRHGGCKTLVIHVLHVDLDDPAADARGFGIPGDVVADPETLAHVRLHPIMTSARLDDASATALPLLRAVPRDDHDCDSSVALPVHPSVRTARRLVARRSNSIRAGKLPRGAC